MFGMLNEGIRMSHTESRMFDQSNTFEEPNEKTKRFFRLLKNSEKMLYPGCTKYSKLSFLVNLLHIKCLSGWSNNSITILLEFLRDAFPSAKENIPESYYKLRKFLKDEHDYEKIDMCCNNCIFVLEGECKS